MEEGRKSEGRKEEWENNNNTRTEQLFFSGEVTEVRLRGKERGARRGGASGRGKERRRM